jgi:hypothetical protein
MGNWGDKEVFVLQEKTPRIESDISYPISNLLEKIVAEKDIPKLPNTIPLRGHLSFWRLSTLLAIAAGIILCR